MAKSKKDDEALIEELLTRWREGDTAAGKQFFTLAYAEMRRIAAFHFRGEKPGHTLQPTAMVNEIFLKLLGGRKAHWQNSAHFYRAFSQMVWMALVDHAREKRAVKRVAPEPDRDQRQAGPRYEHVLTLRRILVEVEKDDPRAVQVAELRVLWGMKDHEIAEALDISVATVKRDWKGVSARIGDLFGKMS